MIQDPPFAPGREHDDRGALPGGQAALHAHTVALALWRLLDLAERNHRLLVALARDNGLDADGRPVDMVPK